MSQRYIAPSILSANFLELGKDIEMINKSEAHWIHYDVMDGVFVPDKTIGYESISKLNLTNTIPLDVHLMVSSPTKNLQKYLDAGANILTVHFESYSSRSQLISDFKKIRENHALVGLSFKPSTDISKVLQYLSYVDVVLVMGVEPGKSGQEFMEPVFSNIKIINDYRVLHNLNYLIEVDGGINFENNKKIISLGADILVSGNLLFNSENKKETIAELKNI